MNKKDNRVLNESSTSTPGKENQGRHNWVEDHGGLVFLIIVVSVIVSVSVYDFFMN
jgi:hypothetical protein